MLLTASGASGCDESQIDPKHTLEFLAAELENKNDVSYDATAHLKLLSSEDTTFFKGTVRLVRDNADSLFGGLIHFNTAQHNMRLYDGKYVYVLDKGMPPTLYDMEGSDNSSPITGNISDAVVNWDFVKPDRLRALASDTTINLSVSPNQLADGRQCLTITASLPDGNEFTRRIRKYYITKDADEILGYSFRTTFQGEQQYDSVMFTNMTYGKVNRSDILKTGDSLSKAMEWTAYEEPDESYFELLPEGTSAPLISGKHPITGKTISLADYRGRVVILDFFYMSCMPCIKTIPKFNALQEKFRDKGLVVIGINSKDNSAEGLNKLPGFMEKPPLWRKS